MISKSLRRILPYIAILLGLCWAGSGYALAQNSVSAGFERDVNRYLWTSATEMNLNAGRWNVKAKNAFRSDAYILFNDQLSFRNENRLQFRAQKPLNKSDLDLVAMGKGDWYSLSRVFRQESWLGLRFGRNKPFWIEPVVGLAIDSRPGFGQTASKAPIRTDMGPAIGLQFGMPMTDLSGYLVQVRGSVRMEKTSPRVGRLLRTEASGRRIYENTTLRTLVHAASVRRDSYQAASFLNRDDTVIRPSETVESTRSDTVNVFLEVETHLAESFWVTGGLDVSTNSRSVQTLRAPSDALFFDSNFNRKTVEATLAARYVKGDTQIRLATVAGAEVERRKLDNADNLPSAQAAQKLSLLRQADNERGYLSLQQSLLTSFKPWWQFQYDGSANILRHDTPEVNPDDRDELLFNAQVGSRFRVREDIFLTVQVLGSWFHTVYIKANRSSENNVQRSLRYRPAVEWHPGRNTSLRVGSEVRATYTVDDFLLPGRRPTDQSAREMRHEFEFEHATSDGIRIKANGSYSDLRLGRFMNDAFAEIPFDTLKTYSGWARIQTSGKIQAELGLRFFIRTDFDRSASVRYTHPETGLESRISRMGRTRIDQIGPTTAISWFVSTDAQLRLEGWAMVQRVSHILYGELPEGLESAIRRASSRGNRSVIPNITVSMRWTM